MIHYENIVTPLGNMVAGVSSDSVKFLWFEDSEEVHDERNINHPVIQKIQNQMGEYFDGQRKIFDLKLEPEGTEFQKSVWKILTEIPYGRCISYLELALKVDNKNAVRAVANANAKNPILILIPCHRVIGSDNQLTGYSGGLENKSKILELESSQMNLFK